MEKVLGGVAGMNRVPAALFLVDITHENIALKEAQRLNVNTLGIVDTNSDPTRVDFAIPGNDDAAKSVSILTNYIAMRLQKVWLSALLRRKAMMPLTTAMRKLQNVTAWMPNWPNLKKKATTVKAGVRNAVAAAMAAAAVADKAEAGLKPVAAHPERLHRSEQKR